MAVISVASRTYSSPARDPSPGSAPPREWKNGTVTTTSSRTTTKSHHNEGRTLLIRVARLGWSERVRHSGAVAMVI